MTEKREPTVLSPMGERTLEEQRSRAWALIRERVSKCRSCPLCETRNHTVFGEGPMNADIMFIGEGPGKDEDEQGIPFIGKAGQLLSQIFEAAGLPREEVFISNVVKCRPPGNRVPAVEEMISCFPFLEAQIALIDPKMIICLGSTPTKWMLKTSEGITKLRGRWFNWRGIDLMPMFHPSYLLRNQSRKKGSPKDLTWDDIREIKHRRDLLLEAKGPAT